MGRRRGCQRSRVTGVCGVWQDATPFNGKRDAGLHHPGRSQGLIGRGGSGSGRDAEKSSSPCHASPRARIFGLVWPLPCHVAGQGRPRDGPKISRASFVGDVFRGWLPHAVPVWCQFQFSQCRFCQCVRSQCQFNPFQINQCQINQCQRVTSIKGRRVWQTRLRPFGIRFLNDGTCLPVFAKGCGCPRGAARRMPDGVRLARTVLPPDLPPVWPPRVAGLSRSRGAAVRYGGPPRSGTGRHPHRPASARPR